MIRELATFEKLRAQCRIDAAAIRRHLFGRNRPAEALIAWQGRVPVGYAVYFRTFSTFEGKPGIYIEDLFVRAPFRHRGIGLALLQAVGKVARDSGAGRVEWTVLTWNRNARRLYARIGAREKPEWLLLRVEGAAVRRFPAKNRWR
jgi:GNAT superfamily N-acetyltransferase